MELNSDLDSEKADLDNTPRVAGKYSFPVISGSSSPEYVVEMQLLDEPADQAADVPVGEGGISMDGKAREEVSGLWSKARIRHAEGRAIDGWISPIDQINELPSMSLESSPNNESDSSGEYLLGESLGNDTRDSLLETLSSFNENAISFKEHLENLKGEVQALPMFQGAFRSLNASFVGQREEIKDLRSVCDLGISALLENQQEVKITLDRFYSAIGEGLKKDNSHSTVTAIEASNEMISELMKISSTQSQGLLRIESHLKNLDIGRFQGNLETIYKATKRSLDESRQGFLSITKQLADLDSKLSSPQGIASEEGLLELQGELGIQLEAILKMEKKIDSLKTKYTIGFAITMGVLGLILGASVRFF